MFTKTALATAAIVAGVSAISFDPRCDAARDPDWNDCQKNFDKINDQSGSDANYQWNLPIMPGGGCLVFYEAKCQVAICSQDNKPVPQYLVVDAVDTLIQDCKYAGAGGKATSKDAEVSMYVEAYSVNQPGSRKRDMRKGRRLATRDDREWNTAYVIDNASPEQYWHQIQAALPKGSKWTLTQEDSQTNSVKTSISIDADLFEIFKASTSTEFGYEETLTTSTSQEIPNSCDGEGYLYWTPLFTQYHGGYSGDGPSPVDIFVPISQDNDQASGKYIVRCSN